MKAISSRNLCALALLLLLAGCGGGTTPPCSGTTCLAPASDFLFESNLNQISTFQVDSNVGVVLATLPAVTGPNAAGGMVLSSNNFLYVSDFENNTVDAFSVNTSSGILTPVSGSPFTVGPNPGAEGMAVDPAGKFLFVTQPNANQVAAFTINSMGN